jgi:hypothetical protein
VIDPMGSISNELSFKPVKLGYQSKHTRGSYAGG